MSQENLKVPAEEKRASTQNAGVRELHEKLREAAFVREYPHEYPKGTRWSGAIFACHAMARFIHDSGWDPRLAAVFLEIKEGFKDLERGTKPPIFSTVTEPLKRDRSLHRKFCQTWAAVLLEMAMQEGEEEKQAAARIARSIRKWPALRTQGPTETTLINWRKQIKCGSSEERKVFDHICEALQKQHDGGLATI
jgi:hypothetical protein